MYNLLKYLPYCLKYVVFPTKTLYVMQFISYLFIIPRSGLSHIKLYKMFVEQEFNKHIYKWIQ